MPGKPPHSHHAGHHARVERHARGKHREGHRSNRTGWLRAAVLGSNDAIVSTASLMIGVAASNASRTATLVAGTAGLVAGAMSMAVGEYVSVSAQRDAERADIAKETAELAEQPTAELRELAGIYVDRGLPPALAMEVAKHLTAKDDLAAHLRDELGIEPHALARPLQAAWISAASFATFALVPILALLAAPATTAVAIAVVAIASIVALGVLGWFGASLGGAPRAPATARVVIGGALAMAITAGIGHVVGVAAG